MLQEIKVSELEKFNPFTKIEKEWALVTAGTLDKCNTMTANWITLGYLWRKNVAFVYVRPQRYTFEFTEKNDYITLSFFGEEYRKVLTYCGTKSGRNEDKIKKSNLTPVQLGGGIGFEEAKLVLVGRKIYTDWIKEDNFIDKQVIPACYPQHDFHKFYIIDIEKVFIQH
ncbi:MAG: flavin reductase family protein [Bacilli bacterium]|nr:flavin reductase family protein [Bacilli bacterium]MDD3422360.1 flavin reductase family protein [Bacilli bacterium]MDD4066165.1 flavin reductase family protein [Bacilli bacterium]